MTAPTWIMSPTSEGALASATLPTAEPVLFHRVNCQGVFGGPAKLKFNPDATLLFLADEEQGLLTLAVADSRLVKALQGEDWGRFRGFSEDGRWVIHVKDDINGVVLEVRETEGTAIYNQFDGFPTLWQTSKVYPTCAMFGENAVAYGSGNSEVTIQSFAAEQEPIQFSGYGGWITSLIYNSRKEILLSMDGYQILVWNHQGTQLAQLTIPGGRIPVPTDRTGDQMGDQVGMSHIACSPNGRYIVSITVSDNNLVFQSTLNLWGLGSGAGVQAQAPHQFVEDGYLIEATFSSNQAVLAVCGSFVDSGLIVLWDVATGQKLYTLQSTEVIIGIAFSPDNRILAIATTSGVYLWHLNNWLIDLAANRDFPDSDEEDSDFPDSTSSDDDNWKEIRRIFHLTLPADDSPADRFAEEQPNRLEELDNWNVVQQIFDVIPSPATPR